MEMSQSVDQALGLIDEQLERIQSREIVSSAEVSDLLPVSYTHLTLPTSDLV